MVPVFVSIKQTLGDERSSSEEVFVSFFELPFWAERVVEELKKIRVHSKIEKIRFQNPLIIDIPRHSGDYYSIYVEIRKKITTIYCIFGNKKH